MKMIAIALLALVALAAAAPASKDVDNEKKVVPAILRSEFDQKPNGGYDFNFETEDGTNRNENGEVKEIVDDEKETHKVVVVRGAYSYTDPDGKLQTITYYADETGFHAEGEGVPKVARR